MSEHKWLDTYYGKDWMEKLSPRIVMNGRDNAVIKVTSGTAVGYVLIKKSGHHGVTPHESLHEGTPSDEDLHKMEKRLIDRDR